MTVTTKFVITTIPMKPVVTAVMTKLVFTAIMPRGTLTGASRSLHLDLDLNIFQNHKYRLNNKDNTITYLQ